MTARLLLHRRILPQSHLEAPWLGWWWWLSDHDLEEALADRPVDRAEACFD
jgi:hypothetical protein